MSLKPPLASEILSSQGNRIILNAGSGDWLGYHPGPTPLLLPHSLPLRNPRRNVTHGDKEMGMLRGLWQSSNKIITPTQIQKGHSCCHAYLPNESLNFLLCSLLLFLYTLLPFNEIIGSVSAANFRLFNNFRQDGLCLNRVEFCEACKCCRS